MHHPPQCVPVGSYKYALLIHIDILILAPKLFYITHTHTQHSTARAHHLVLT